MKNIKTFIKGIGIEPVIISSISEEGDIEVYNNALRIYLQGAARDIVTTDQVQTLTNKTFTAPTLNNPSFTGTVSFLSLSTGILHINSSGIASSSLLVNADVSASAAIAYSKLASLTSGNILVGNGSNVATSVSMSGAGTISNTGSFALVNNAVDNSKLAQMAAHTFKGNNTGSTANASDVTVTQLTAALNTFTTSLQGVVPSSGGGSTNFLRADGTWAAPTDTGMTALTGDVTASGSGSVVATIANNAVTNAKAAQMAGHTFKGNNTGSTANAIDLTATQLTAELNIFTTSLQGLVPSSGGGTTNFLRADGTFAVPPGTASPLTTKGDLYAFSTINDRLPVGTNGQVLTADSTQATGLKWAAGGGGSGDVVGPASSTNNAYVLFDGTTGKLIKNQTFLTQNGSVLQYYPTGVNGAALDIEPHEANSSSDNAGVSVTFVSPGATGITNSYDFYAAAPASGTRTNFYGLYVEDVSAAATTINDAIHVVGGRSYFGGPIQSTITDSATASLTISKVNTTNPGTAISITSQNTGGTGATATGIKISTNIDTGSQGIGFFAHGNMGGAGSAGNYYAYYSDYTGSTAQTGDSYSYYARPPTAGTRANYYGLFIDDVSGTGASSDNDAIHVTNGRTFLGGNLRLDNLTASTAIALDANKQIISSATTATELGYVSGVTSAIQTQLNAKGSGTVTSVNITAPVGYTAGSAVTTSGSVSLTLNASQAISASDIDWSTGNIFTKSITNTTPTFTFSNTADGQTIVVAITATTGTITWPTTTWAGGTPPVQTANKTDIYTFIKIGSTFYGSVVQNF